MSRKFQFSLGWGLFGTCFGTLLGIAICWVIGADPQYWMKTSIVLAVVFGALGAFFGDEMVALIFEVLSYLIS